MQPFSFEKADDLRGALQIFDGNVGEDQPATETPAQYLAGGTTLLDLMKLDVMRPSRVIDIGKLARSSGTIEINGGTLRLGAMVTMAQAADHPELQKQFPVLAQALQLAASPQIRNMASLGGNVLQRTRCTYFRDTSYPQCNKRNPGSGCAALDGVNRQHAILGTSDQCIASYPGDFAQALLALDAEVALEGPRGARALPFADLHRQPGSAPNRETALTPGELITGFTIPAASFARRSLYLKIRDRESYEFALASAAVALDFDGKTVKQARIALGGVATVPWRARQAEEALAGKPIDDQTLKAAADLAFAQARPREHNAYKVELGKRTLMRAVRQAATMEIPA